MMSISPFWRLSLCLCLLTACSAEPIRTAQKETQPLQQELESMQQKREPLQSPETYEQLRQQAIDSVFIQNPDKSEPEFIGEKLEVNLDNFKFSPNEVHLKAGTITQIKLSNASLNLHYFGGRDFFNYGAEVIRFTQSNAPPGFTHIPVAANSSRIVYLFAKDPGEYPLNCNVPSHSLLGMKGTLFVE